LVVVDAIVLLAEVPVLEGVGMGVVNLGSWLKLVECVSGVGVGAEEGLEELKGLQGGEVLKFWRAIRFPFIPARGFLQ
jgi:hypothetical protein